MRQAPRFNYLSHRGKVTVAVWHGGRVVFHTGLICAEIPLSLLRRQLPFQGSLMMKRKTKEEFQ